MIKLVILKKHSNYYYCWHNLQKKLKILELSVEQILTQYQGFEGDLVEMLSIKGDDEEQKEVIKKCKLFCSIQKHVVLFITSPSDSL